MPNKSLDASGGSDSRNWLGAAEVALIRAVEIVKLISRGQLNRYAAFVYQSICLSERATVTTTMPRTRRTFETYRVRGSVDP